MPCLTYVVNSNIFMANGSLHQGRESPPNKYRSWPAAAWSRAARGSASPFTRVRFIGTPGISLPGKSLATRSTHRNSRGHSIGYLETAAPDCRAAQKVCKKQRPQHRGDHATAQQRTYPDSQGKPLGTLRSLGLATEPSLSRSRLLW